jgi:hypothetical protein
VGWWEKEMKENPRELVREEASSVFLFSPFVVAAGVNKLKQVVCMSSCCV